MPVHLHPCPFCGSRRAKVSQFVTIFFVVCEDCYADGPAKFSRAEASEAWNDRIRQPRSSDGDGHA